MKNITIHLDRVDGNEALKKVASAMRQVGFEDELTITMSAVDAHHSGEISTLLAENHFDYQPIGGHQGDQYVITARRTAKKI